MKFPTSSRNSARQFRPSSPQTIFPFERTSGMPVGHGYERGSGGVGGNTAAGQAAWGGPRGSAGYAAWMRQAKFFRRFLPYAAFEMGREIGEMLKGPLDAGNMMPGNSQGWVVQCDIRNGMPLYEYHSGGSLCTIGYFNAGHRWYDAFDPTPYGLIPGPQYWPGFGWYSVFVGQNTPHPQASPEIYNRRLEVHTATDNPAQPVPYIQILPDDRWPDENPLQNAVAQPLPGYSGNPIPLRIAMAMGGFGPRISPAPAPAPGTRPGPGPGPGPGTPVPPVPPVVPGLPPRPGVRPVPFVPARPQKGEREHKWSPKGPLGKAVRWALAGVNTATEVFDFFEAMWWALDPKSRREAFEFFGYRPPTPFERAFWVASHPGDINGEKAIKNLLSNAIGDEIGGHVGRKTKDWHAANWAAGWDSRGRGPAETMNRLWQK